MNLMHKSVFVIMVTLLPAAKILFAQDCTGLVTNTNSYWPAPTLAKPGYLQSVVDPVFGTTITRVTGNAGTPISNVPGGVWGSTNRHNYSKDAVWNADQTLMVIKTIKGSGGTLPAGTDALIIDGSTYQPLYARLGFEVEARWHPTNARLMVYITSAGELGSYDVPSNARTIIALFSGYSGTQFGPWEGQLSNDGNWVVINATRTSDNKSVGFAYNMSTHTKYPDIDLSGFNLDWVSISPLGDKILVYDTNLHTSIYDLQGNQLAFWSQSGQPDHYDMRVDTDGQEIATGVAKSAPYDGNTIKRRMSDGVITALITKGYGTHGSTRDLTRSGYMFETYQTTSKNWPPYLNELLAVKLDGTRAERICHLYSKGTTYDAQPQACPSPDGKRAIFASDWNKSGDIQGYVVDFRSKCP